MTTTSEQVPYLRYYLLTNLHLVYLTLSNDVTPYLFYEYTYFVKDIDLRNTNRHLNQYGASYLWTYYKVKLCVRNPDMP